VWECFSPRPDSLWALSDDILLAMLDKVRQLKTSLIESMAMETTQELVTLRGKNEVRDGVSFM